MPPGLGWNMKSLLFHSSSLQSLGTACVGNVVLGFECVGFRINMVQGDGAHNS